MTLFKEAKKEKVEVTVERLKSKVYVVIAKKRRYYKRSHPGYAKEKPNGWIWASNTNGSLGNQQEGNRSKRAAANGCYQKECSQAVYSFT